MEVKNLGSIKNIVRFSDVKLWALFDGLMIKDENAICKMQILRKLTFFTRYLILRRQKFTGKEIPY